MAQKPIIIWLRNDLRLRTNPALYHGVNSSKPVIILYIDDNITPAKNYYSGGAMRLWTHYALKDLRQSLNIMGGDIIIKQGDPLDILHNLTQAVGADTIYWNRLYMPQEIVRDSKIKEYFKNQGLNIQSFNGSLLYEPHTIKNMQNMPYKVFTPFKKACLALGLSSITYPSPTQINFYKNIISDKNIEDILPLPKNPDWGSDVVRHWNISQNAAFDILDNFLQTKLSGYKIGRDFPAKNHVSLLSPYLARGQISVFDIIKKLEDYPDSDDKAHFISELLWREFSYYLMFHFPYIEHSNFRPEFDNFPWTNNQELLKKWQFGKTGIPIIDAGMRELRQSGYMHNRVRMITASFLVKHLMIDWRYGEAWFRDNLFDFDVANNICSWQWVAGSGADAAPYFRIFNPLLQSEKFDKDGEYIKKYFLNYNKYAIHTPINPIVDLSDGRIMALNSYKTIKHIDR